MLDSWIRFLKMVPGQTRGQECHEFNAQPLLAYSEIRGGERIKEQASKVALRFGEQNLA